jgi:cell division transport system permease protein
MTMMKNIPELASLINFGNIAVIYVSLLILGVLLTTLSTFFAMRKYLRADVDELYE